MNNPYNYFFSARDAPAHLNFCWVFQIYAHRWGMRGRESLQWKATSNEGSGGWMVSPEQMSFLAGILLSNCRDWQQFPGWVAIGWELLSEQLPQEILRAECQPLRQTPRPCRWKDSKRLHSPWECQERVGSVSGEKVAYRHWKIPRWPFGSRRKYMLENGNYSQGCSGEERMGCYSPKSQAAFMTSTKGKLWQLCHKVVMGWYKLCSKRVEIVFYFFFCFLWGNLMVIEEWARKTTSLKKKVCILNGKRQHLFIQWM